VNAVVRKSQGEMVNLLQRDKDSDQQDTDTSERSWHSQCRVPVRSPWLSPFDLLMGCGCCQVVQALTPGWRFGLPRNDGCASCVLLHDLVDVRNFVLTA